MKWLNKLRNKGYLILFVTTGVIYLSVVDDWQVYAEPMGRVKHWYEDIKKDLQRGMNVRASGDTVSGMEGAGMSGYGDMTLSGNGDLALAGTDGNMVSLNDGQPSGGGQQPSGADQPPVEGQQPSGADQPSGGGQQPSGAEQPPVGGQQPSGADQPSGVDQPPVGGQQPSGEADGAGLTETGGTESTVEYCTVEDDYFGDAVFIGDSRTVGMFEYGGLEDTAAFYASTGLTVYKLFDAEIVAVEGQKKKISVEQALSENSYAKIYLMVGINEMGTGTVESFTEAYKKAVDHLMELQPDAILYIQAIMKVTTERSEQGDYINNEGIEARNEMLRQLADNERVFYLDVNPSVCDETGGMITDYTFDGVHLKAQYIEIWKNFLKEHAVVRQAEPAGEPEA